MERMGSAGRGMSVIVAIGILFAGVGYAWTPSVANDVPYGTPADVAYAEKLWTELSKERLVGPNRANVWPNIGKRPHGAIQQIVASTVTVDGVARRVVVKTNYAGQDLKQATVYADPEKFLSHYAIMAKREAGYDEKNKDWFWVAYAADGALVKHEGVAIAGRADTGNTQGCIGCHVKKGGADLEVMTPQ